MKLAEAFLLSCAEAFNLFGEEDPADRLTEVTASDTAMVEPGNLVKVARMYDMIQRENTAKLPDTDDLPTIYKNPSEYKDGFQAGTDFLPLGESSLLHGRAAR